MVAQLPLKASWARGRHSSLASRPGKPAKPSPQKLQKVCPVLDKADLFLRFLDTSPPLFDTSLIQNLFQLTLYQLGGAIMADWFFLISLLLLAGLSLAFLTLCQRLMEAQ